MNRTIERMSWPRGRITLLLVGLVAVISLALVARGARESSGHVGGASAALPASAATKTSEAGSVTLAATWPGPSAGLSFNVAMDTHSVDLDSLDLGESAVLRTDNGREVKPTGWEASKGGHHREGKLIFPDKGPDGTPVIGPETRAVELVIRGVAGVPERTLRWDLQG